MTYRRAPSHPPLACRPSPPQGGRSAALPASLFLQRQRLAKAMATSNLPPCGGGKEGRTEGGGRDHQPPAALKRHQPDG
ncbi:MAG: hypothetical protein EOR03_08725 [Mesorhizobium sp.]|nr:MAG: hypothetical protein EOR03_08725 [Mesorhizobium sp.]